MPKSARARRLTPARTPSSRTTRAGLCERWPLTALAPGVLQLVCSDEWAIALRLRSAAVPQTTNHKPQAKQLLRCGGDTDPNSIVWAGLKRENEWRETGKSTGSWVGDIPTIQCHLRAVLRTVPTVHVVGYLACLPHCAPNSSHDRRAWSKYLMFSTIQCSPARAWESQNRSPGPLQQIPP